MSTTTALTPETVAEMFHAAIEEKERSNARSAQARAGILGPSDIGFCRQKALLTLRQTEPTNERNMWPAQVGTAVGDYIESGLKMLYPNWIIGSVDHRKVTAHLVSGKEVTGTPDAIATDLNAVLDLKSRDGLKLVARTGSNRNEAFQRWLYTKGAADEGLIDPSKPMYYGNVYVDRSGADENLIVELEEFDPMLEDEIDQWIEDVIYAHLHNEDASRDIPAPRCESMCEFFDACRGGILPDAEGGEPIEDAERVEAIRMYAEGRDMEATGRKMKSEASALLANTNGIAAIDDEDWQVRWTYTNPVSIAASERSGYYKIDVRKVRKPKSKSS